MSIICLQTRVGKNHDFLEVFVYATHATQAIAFEWKPGFTGLSIQKNILRPYSEKLIGYKYKLKLKLYNKKTVETCLLGLAQQLH